jgi:hypothetical protein
MAIFYKQIYHFVALVFLLLGVIMLFDDAARSGQILGLPTRVWFWLSMAIPILHQIYVWFSWRTQLKYGLITKIFGNHGFMVYAIGFSVLIVSRPVLIILLSLSNRHSIVLSPAFVYALSLIFALLSGYVFYSVRTYFGFKRAYGIDHFDESYRHLPFVRDGIFRFTANAMYTVGFLFLWVPGLILFSKAALIAAGFNHLYIWVHYYTVELPEYLRQFKEWQHY